MNIFTNGVNRLLARTKVGRVAFQCYSLRDYLQAVGWLKSRTENKPVDRSGAPLPWLTYPSINFLNDRIRSTMVVFEYGSGSSTLWWAKRVFRVVSFEHDHAWYNKLLKLIPENVEYVYCEMTPNGDYSRGVKKYSNMFDIIVIDGRDRVNCAKNSLGALKEDGVIIWDNSERSKYAEGYAFLKDNGFKRIEFTGIGPVNSFAWSTTVFYRNKNCLAI